MGRHILRIERPDDVFDSHSVLRVLHTTTFFFPRCDDSVGYQSPPLIIEPHAPHLSGLLVTLTIHKSKQLALYVRGQPKFGPREQRQGLCLPI